FSAPWLWREFSDVAPLWYACDMPDVFGILSDRTITGKDTDPRHVEDSLMGPSSRAGEFCAHLCLHGDIRREIGQVNIPTSSRRSISHGVPEASQLSGISCW